MSLSSAAEAPSSLVDDVTAYATLQPDALARRWAIFRRLREEAPLFAWDHTVLVTRYREVDEILTDPARFLNRASSSGVSAEVLARLTPEEARRFAAIVDNESHWMNSANGAAHAALRSLGIRVFTPRAIAGMEERIAAVVDTLLSEVDPDRFLDFRQEIAFRLPLIVISEIMGIPEEMRAPIHEAWVSVTPARTGLAWRSQLPRHLDQAYAGYQRLEGYMTRLIESNRERPSTPMMANLVAALEDPDTDFRDLIMLMQLLFSAGHQTTEDLLSNGVHALLTHPAQWAALRDDPELAAGAVEEILRFSSPGQDVERFAAHDMEMAGVPLAAGQQLTVAVGAANRDPEQFADPETFDIRRTDARRHLAFGKGPHFCLGAALSRMEGRIALAAIARRFPDIELASPVPDWLPTTHFLGLKELRLRMGRDAARATAGRGPVSGAPGRRTR